MNQFVPYFLDTVKAPYEPPQFADTQKLMDREIFVYADWVELGQPHLMGTRRAIGDYWIAKFPAATTNLTSGLGSVFHQFDFVEAGFVGEGGR